MPSFRYQARGSGGEALQGVIEAVSIDAVANQLLAGGMTPVRISGVPAGSDPLAAFRERFRDWRGGAVVLDDLILLCRQMHTLTKAGVPIIRALRGLAESARKPALARALKGVVEDLESGRDLSYALGRHSAIFPPLFSSMVQVGESTGRLDEAFLRIGEYLMQEKETRDRVKAALRYPAIVIGAIAIAIAVLSLFVIPAFEKVFRGFKAELPLPTRIILGISHFAQAWWPAILVGLVLLAFAGRRYLRTEEGRLRWDRLKLRLPVVGSIILRATLARFGRAFAMSIHAGVPLIQALNLTARAVGNVHVGTCLDQMRNGVERGDTLSRSAATTRLFTPLVLQMLMVGEETGEVDTMLEDVAGFYEREVDYDLKNLTSAIEPILIVVIGGMVLVLALGVFLPMWNLASVARGGG